ncbi:MAG: glycosyltransferase [Thermodesulfobacteriota bacterium]
MNDLSGQSHDQTKGSERPVLVSVVIPTYNRAHLLMRAVESVRRQTFRDFELIVVDDGSSDGTSELLEGLSADVQSFRHPNRGVAAARNLGIEHSHGELIAFLDSDDEWLPEKLAMQVARYDGANPDFFCHTNEIWLRNGKELSQKKIHRKQGGRFFERALERCLISPSSAMMSRALLDRFGRFDETLPAAEDYDLWLRVTAYCEVQFIPRPLVIKHGGHPDQLSRTVPSIDRFRIRAIEKILADPALPRQYREAAVKELLRKCRIVASGCAAKGKIAEAEAYLELTRIYQLRQHGS